MARYGPGLPGFRMGAPTPVSDRLARVKVKAKLVRPITSFSRGAPPEIHRLIAHAYGVISKRLLNLHEWQNTPMQFTLLSFNMNNVYKCKDSW